MKFANRDYSFMNNPSTADFAVWLRWLEFFSFNIRFSMPRSKNPAPPCQPTNLTVAPHYLQIMRARRAGFYKLQRRIKLGVS